VADGRRRRAALAVAAWLIAIAGAAPGVASADPPAPPAPILDPGLLDAIDEAATVSTRLPVEIVTDDTVGAAASARAVGGVVVGSVPGEVVQVSVAAGLVDDLARAVPGDHLQRARRVHRPVPPAEAAGSAELGPAGANGAGTVAGAAAWHAAGIRGGVKVGIIDFFDLSLWNPAEHGPLPAGDHLFCRDTSGVPPPSSYCPILGQSGDGLEHGVAVAEVVKDVAPDAELYLATVGTVSDLRAAIDWFAAQGVGIVSRSLGAAYDGPGDGTGPLAAVVDRAAASGITWFNSAGNDADGSYGRFTGGVTADGYVDFDASPGVDTRLLLSGQSIGLDGIRWSDWGKPAAATTDYAIEFYDPGAPQPFLRLDAPQRAGAPPLEAVDVHNEGSGPFEIAMRVVAPGDGTNDVVEVGVFAGGVERSSVAFSAAKPVVDSRNPALVAVGAVEGPSWNTVAFYSSQGPTNDGRVKPDVTAASCVSSSVYAPGPRYGSAACFRGTSASAPSAAGVAALLLSRGLALTGAPLAALVRANVRDLGPPGPDSAFGAGFVTLPAPPAGIDTRPSQFVPAATAQRILDTRAASATPGARVGPFPPSELLTLAVPAAPGGVAASAVAISLVSVDSVVANYLQALPTLNGQVAGFANLNVAFPGQIKPNFAIVPLGAGGTISVYLPTGGNVVVDLMGWFTPTGGGAVAGGRFVALDPVRALDTRPGYPGPVPAGWVAHKPVAGEVVRVPASVPADASALVLNVTATEAEQPGFLRAQPTGATGLGTANGNFVPGTDSGTMSIVPVGADGSVSVYTSASTHLVVDVTGYITGAGSTPGTDGLFVPLTPGRAYDSRLGDGMFGDGATRTLQLTGVGGPAAGVTRASALSMNVAADAAPSPGFVTLSPAGSPRPVVSNLNFPRASPISNAAMVRLSAGGALDAYVNRATHLIVDVNGWFTGPA